MLVHMRCLAQDKAYARRFSTLLCKVLPERLPLRTTYFAYQRAVLPNPLKALPLRGVRVQSHAESMTDSRTHCLHAVRQI